MSNQKRVDVQEPADWIRALMVLREAAAKSGRLKEIDEGLAGFFGSLPPQLATALLQEVGETRSEDSEPEPDTADPRTALLEPVFLDSKTGGYCCAEHPCEGMRYLLSKACIRHGGIVGTSQDPESPAPEFVGYVPHPEHNDGSRVIVFNYCPCCGREVRDFPDVSQSVGEFH